MTEEEMYTRELLERALTHLAQAKLLFQRAGRDEDAAEVAGLIHLLSDRKQVPA